MSNRTAPPATLALRGWRARAWAWVLFLALFKGLIPHAALASVTMSGNPALLWCAPGTPSAASDSKATQAVSAAAHACVCASSADGAVPVGNSVKVPVGGAYDQAQPVPPLATVSERLLLPPARGPPAL